MSNQDPYVEIEKVPLYASDKMQSKGYSVRLEKPESESGWEEVGIVSSDYLLVPNREVRNMALDIAQQSGLDWREEKEFFDGKRFVYALTADSSLTVDVEVDDVVSLGMLFENSYDGSRKLSASMFAYRLACSNGMLVPQLFARMRIKHELTSSGWEGEIRRALTMIGAAGENLQGFASGARQLTEMSLSSGDLQHIREGVLDGLPITLWGKTVDRFLLEGDHTGWGLLNAGTGIVWHQDRSIQDFNYNEQITEGLLTYAIS